MNSTTLTRVVLAILFGGLSATAQIVVTTTADSGAGSLRQAIADAQSAPGAKTITFAPALDGQTIQFTSTINILLQVVTVDATALPGGITLQGGGTTLFSLPYSFSDPFSTGGYNSLSLFNVKLAGGPISGVGAINCGYTQGLTLSKCVVTGFKATAIQSTGRLTVQACTFSNNSAEDSSGAIWFGNNDRSSLLVSECTFDGNTSTGSGGALTINGSGNPRDSGEGTVSRCTFKGNHAGSGGAIYVHSFHPSFTQCTFSGNTATFEGGAIAGGYDFVGSPSGFTMQHCTISGNSAANGGGVFVSARGVYFSNSIVAGNAATGNGGDIFFSGLPPFITTSGLITQQYYTDEVGPHPYIPPFTNANPMLGALANNGGPTQTMALLPGSPARNVAVESTATADQRGFLTVGTPDIGAYEALAGDFSSFAAWAAASTGNPLGFNADLDGDGTVDGLEYALNLDPTLSDLKFVPAITKSGGMPKFSFRYRPSARDLRYIVHRSVNLKNPAAWTEIYRFDTSTGAITESGATGDENAQTQTITLTDSVAGPAQFYRLRVELIP